MASERQIAANRRNARKSTGPRSAAGKKRAGRNAYRHGLSVSMSSNAAFALERARAVAEAELELARVRRAKVALIERASAFGELDPPRPPRVAVSQALRVLNSIVRNPNAPTGGRVTFPEPIDSSATMPSQEPYRSAEAIRRVLPVLRKLDRYERRAAGRRDQALRALSVEFSLTAISSCK